MKTIFKVTITLMIIVLFSTILNARIYHRSNGQICIGEDPSDIVNVADSKKDTITMLKIHGPFTEWRAGGRLSFGDQSSKYNLNVMVGELDVVDTDKLWLHGKYGLYFTSNPHAEDTIFYYDVQRGNNVHFNCDVHTDGVFVASDQRFKDNISPLNTTLSSLKYINPVSYSLKPRHFNSSVNTRGAASEKEGRDQQFFNQYYNELNNDSLRYGFIAQEIKEIYPELVRTDKSGYMYVDYIGMIPILVNAINELQEKIDILENNNVKTVKSSTIESLDVDNDLASEPVVASLKQNTPNPFNSNTTIEYSLSDDVVNAQLYVYNMQGSQIRKYELLERGNCALTISACDLEAGMYIYTLIADGKEIDTKRMILTE